MTYEAFAPDSTMLIDVCSKQNLFASICNVFRHEDCEKLRLLDLVVTRNYIFLATSFGLVKSIGFKGLLSEPHIDKMVCSKQLFQLYYYLCLNLIY